MMRLLSMNTGMSEIFRTERKNDLPDIVQKAPASSEVVQEEK